MREWEKNEMRKTSVNGSQLAGSLSHHQQLHIAWLTN